ncbi:MAG TPA: 5'/3'-nucleotidase SurE [Acidimicrobiales bacterium]|nr:5'/3'-nucleotidase SurE [Acidimicrobiales bacterium]
MASDRVLVTNDDGVHAPGIAALAAALDDAGFDIFIAAPLDDRSGSGAALGPVHLTNGIDYQTAEIPGLAHIPTYAIDGPPALAVMAARLGAFGPPPEVVASGINPGTNTGRAVLHSGTVGAALTAGNFGATGVAVSVDISEPIRYDTAAASAVDAVRWAVAAGPRVVLSVNVPALGPESVRGVRVARLAPFGTVRTAVVGHEDGRVQLELRATEDELDADTDTALVRDGFVAVSALAGIQTLPDLSADAVDALVGVGIGG